MVSFAKRFLRWIPLRLETRSIEVSVDESRGAEITHIALPGGPNALFHADWQTPLPAQLGMSYGSDELDWLSHYRGGWQELFPNAGASCVMDGVPLPFHGEVSSTQWTVETASRSEAVLSAAARLPITIARRMVLDSSEPILRIEETVTSDANMPVPYIWAHHPAFNALPGSVIDLPPASVEIPEGHDPQFNDLAPGVDGVWPFVQGKNGDREDLSVVPNAPCERLAFVHGFNEGWAAIRDRDGGGVAIAWDVTTFPNAWMWTEMGGHGFPWYGRSNILAIEPAASWPSDGLEAAVGRNQAHWLEPKSSRTTWLTLRLLEPAPGSVREMSRNGAVTRST